MESNHKKDIGLLAQDTANGKDAGADNKRAWTTPEIKEADYEITGAAGISPGDGGLAKKS